MVMDAIRNPHKERPQGEPQLGEISRQYVFCVPGETFAYLSDDRDLMIDSGFVRSRFQVPRPRLASSLRSPSMSMQ
jgi:hypothetical protein